MLLLAVPIGAGIWAFAGYAGRSEEDRADTQLTGVLASALQEYSLALDAAGAQASATAGRRDVQTALARRDRARLARVARSDRVRFEIPGRPPVGTIAEPAAVRSVVVVVGGRRVGRVVAGVTLGDKLLGRLSRAAAPAGGGPARLPERAPEWEEREGRRHGLPIHLGEAPRRPARREPARAHAHGEVEASASHARNRILLAGFIGLACVILLVYGFAPVIARGRCSEGQRDQAARVLSHLREGVALVDGGGIVRLWNPSAETITGLKASDVQGKPAVEAVPGWADGPGEGQGGRAAQTLSLPLDSREVFLSVTGVRFTEGTVYAFRDLTEERRLEQMRSDFVATVSHELRTPLASIHGAALTLSRRGDELEPALSERLLTIIREQSERLAELVEQILLAAQLDSGGLRYTSEEFDPRALATGVIEAAGPRIPAEIAVTLTGLPGLPNVVGDPQKARRVLTNLLDNAVKYSPDGGRIDVTLGAPRRPRPLHRAGRGSRHPDDRARADLREVLPPRRGHEPGVGGSGLGLYICRELVNGMGGRLWVMSEPGRGASFSFELPLAAERLGYRRLDVDRCASIRAPIST